MNFVDKILNRITMYRFTLYVLIAIVAWASLITFFTQTSYTFLSLWVSVGFILAVCLVANKIFARVFRVPANAESFYITAFILALIITPPSLKPLDSAGFMFLFWASVIAIASKYILAVYKKHIFNPAAVAVVVTSYAINQGASWWVGTLWMLPVTLVCAFLVIRKVRRADMVFWFLLTATILTLGSTIIRGSDVLLTAKAFFINSPIIFFSSIMLTEPLTSPHTKKLQSFYGALVGVLFAPITHLGSFYFTPEVALLCGNVFAYIVSPKKKLLLTLKEKIPIGKGMYDFVFEADTKLKFRPGQYMEWTLSHKHHDLRGNRRYFTISSAPTEKQIRVGVKFYNPPSTYKQALLKLAPGQTMLAGYLAGDFVLPKNPQEKSVFLAGGIGITPFRSMIKTLVDKKEKRDIITFYSNKTYEEIVYIDVLNQAYSELEIPTVYTLTDEAPQNWQGETGRINPDMIRKYAPDWMDRTYYVSGTHQMVVAMEDMLKSMGLPKKQIKTDFFPGFA